MEEKEVEKSHTEVPLLWYENSTLDVRRQSNNFFKILKGVNFLFRIVYWVKVAIECETVIKYFQASNWLFFIFSNPRVRSPGGGSGNSLQYSSLETPTDRRACWAMVHRVTKSRAWLHTQPSWASLSSLNGLLHMCSSWNFCSPSWQDVLCLPRMYHLLFKVFFFLDDSISMKQMFH